MNKTENKKGKYIYEIIAFVFIIAGIFIIISAYSNFFPWLSSNNIGIFGDYIGGIVGSLWALAGVMLFYSALRKQREEIELQRLQLEDQRKEIEIQRFDNTFFSIIKTA